MSHKSNSVSAASIGFLCLAVASPAIASSGGSLPWEGPLEQIQASITGPVAGAIALIATASSAMMLAFNGEMNDFTRVTARVVLVLGLLLGVAQVVGMFGATGASIGMPELVCVDAGGNCRRGGEA